MASVRLLLSFPSLLVIILIPHPSSSQPKNLVFKKCLDEYGHYTTNSTYQTNLNALLPKLTSDAQINYGFYNSSYGQEPDTTYAMGLCRGDVEPEACRSCLNNSTILLPKLCPDQKDSIGGYDECMLRYSDQENVVRIDSFRIFSIYLSNETSVSDWDEFDAVLRYLLQRLGGIAAAGGSLRKFAAGSAEAEGWRSRAIYAYVQCLPDLSEAECNDCLVEAVSEISNCTCKGKIGGRVIKPTCNFRYENYRFYDGSIKAYALPPLNPSPPPPPVGFFGSSPPTNTTPLRGTW